MGKIGDFLVKDDSHRRSILSCCLFAFVMDELNCCIQDTDPWCMLFEDDVVLINTF